MLHVVLFFIYAGYALLASLGEHQRLGSGAPYEILKLIGRQVFIERNYYAYAADRGIVGQKPAHAGLSDYRNLLSLKAHVDEAGSESVDVIFHLSVCHRHKFSCFFILFKIRRFIGKELRAGGDYLLKIVYLTDGIKNAVIFRIVHFKYLFY